MVFILLALASGILVGFLLKSERLLPVVGLVLLLMLVFSVPSKQKSGWVRSFLWVFLLAYLYFIVHDGNADPLEKFSEKQLTLTGHVISIQMSYEDCFKLEMYADMYADEHETGIVRQRVLVNLKGSLYEIDGMASDQGKPIYADLAGRRIQVSGVVSKPAAAKNPNLFNYQLYLKTRNISTILESRTWECVVLPGGADFLTNALSLYKYHLLERLKKNMSLETFGLLAGILFGEKNDIDDDIYQTFQKNGTAHILSVSGIHVGIIYAYIDTLLGKSGNPLYNCLTVILLIIYAALSGFSPSVVRAVFMILVFISGKLLRERYDLTTCTAFTAFVLLLHNPYNLLNLGFQLSYMAVFILAVLLPWLTALTAPLIEKTNDTEKKFSRAKILKMMLPLFAIQIGMIPITAYIFNYFSLSAFIANVPVILLSGIILPIGILLMLLSLLMGLPGNAMPLTPLADFLFSLISTAVELLLKLMIEINELTAIRGIGFFDIRNPSLIIIFIYYIMLFLICSELGQWCFKLSRTLEDRMPRSKSTFLAGVAFIFLIIICIAAQEDRFSKADLTFIDVGQGDCLHIKTPLGKNILIDGGGSRPVGSGGSGFDVGKKVLQPYLLKSGVSKIDLAVVTHLHDDHFQGIASLSQVMKIEKMVLFSGNQLREKEVISIMNMDRRRLIYVKKGDRVQIEPGVYIDILYPDQFVDASDEGSDAGAKSENENDKNLVMRLYYKGFTVMMTGDLTSADELKMIEAGVDLKADIMKVPHHGSRYSSTEAFIQAVDPDFAVIQVGKNNFGHPNGQIIENYVKEGIMVFRTDRDGAVLFDISENKPPRILTMLSRQWATSGSSARNQKAAGE